MTSLHSINIKGIAKVVVDDQILRVFTPNFTINVEDLTQYYFMAGSTRYAEIVNISIKEKADGSVVVIIFSANENTTYKKIIERLNMYKDITKDDITIEIFEDNIEE